MLGPGCEEVTLAALREFPGGLQVGGTALKFFSDRLYDLSLTVPHHPRDLGGITTANAKTYIEAGASQVIVTSFVFRDGAVDLERLQELVELVGKERIVIDLSCRKKPDNPSGPYYVVTNKWTQYTDYEVK